MTLQAIVRLTRPGCVSIGVLPTSAPDPRGCRFGPSVNDNLMSAAGRLGRSGREVSVSCLVANGMRAMSEDEASGRAFTPRDFCAKRGKEPRRMQ